jgi:cell division transport system permease protein
MIRFIGFSLRQAAQGLWRNRVMNLAAGVTMTLMLVLLASLVIALSGMESFVSYVEGKVDVRAELRDGVTQERIDALTAQLEAMPEVADVTYVSKDQALADFRAERVRQGQPDLTQYVGFNPFPAQLSVRPVDPRDFGQIVPTLIASPIVADVPQEESSVDQLVNLLGVLRTVGVMTLLFVGATVLLIVINSIRMAVMSRRDEIEIMRLVGASDAFIRWPFIAEGALVGVLGAGITLGLLLLASEPIRQLADTLAGDQAVVFSRALPAQLAALVTGAGIALGGVGAWISVRTYLRR